MRFVYGVFLACLAMQLLTNIRIASANVCVFPCKDGS